METVIEVLEMTIYTNHGGFDELNHRDFYFYDSPIRELVLSASTL